MLLTTVFDTLFRVTTASLSSSQSYSHTNYVAYSHPCSYRLITTWLSLVLNSVLAEESSFTWLHRMQARTIATRKVSVRPSVCLSNTWIVTQQKKHVPTFWYQMKDHSVYIHPSFVTRSVVGGATPVTWNFGQLERKRRFSTDIRS